MDIYRNLVIYCVVILFISGCADESGSLADFGYMEKDKNSELVKTQYDYIEEKVVENHYRMNCINTAFLLPEDSVIMFIGRQRIELSTNFNVVFDLYPYSKSDIQPTILIKRDNKYYSKSTKKKYFLSDSERNYTIDLSDEELEIKPVR